MDSDYGTPEQKSIILGINSKMKDFCETMFNDSTNSSYISNARDTTDSFVLFKLCYSNNSELSFQQKEWMFNITKTNMQQMYESSSCGWNSSEKKAELTAIPDSHYLFATLLREHNSIVSVAASSSFSSGSTTCSPNCHPKNDSNKSSVNVHAIDKSYAAFVHFRIIVENEELVLYLYELQIDPQFQRYGLGSKLNNV